MLSMKKIPDDLADKLYAVSDQFVNNGLDVRIDEVAEAVDVPRATLYYYFSGKDDLVSFLMFEKIKRMGTSIQKAIAEGGSVVERLERTIGAMVSSIAESPSLCFNLMGALGHGGTLGEMILASDQATFGPVRELLIEGRAGGELVLDDVQVASSVIGGGVMLATLNDYVMNGEIDAAKVAGTVTPALLRGLVATP